MMMRDLGKWRKPPDPTGSLSWLATLMTKTCPVFSRMYKVELYPSSAFEIVILYGISKWSKRQWTRAEKVSLTFATPAMADPTVPLFLSSCFLRLSFLVSFCSVSISSKYSRRTSKTCQYVAGPSFRFPVSALIISIKRSLIFCLFLWTLRPYVVCRRLVWFQKG